MYQSIIGELEATAFDGAAFSRKIELAFDRALEFASHDERPVDGEIRNTAFDELGEVFDDVEIGLHDLGDFRPLHFQCDHAAHHAGRPCGLVRSKQKQPASRRGMRRPGREAARTRHSESIRPG